VYDGTPKRGRGFGAAQVVLEEKWFGVGLGMAAFSRTRHDVEPSGSLRFGRLDGVSIRADYRYPGVGMGLIGGPRIGVGLNQGRTRKPRVFLGLATTPIPDSTRRTGGFLEIAVPIALEGKFGLSANGFVGGRYHGYETRTRYSVGLGAWLEP
jgi:hypothetical protein